LQQACLAAHAIEEMRGQDVVVLDLTKITPIADYFVIATGTSGRQMRAAAGDVHRLLKASGSSRIGLEGEGSNSWILQDFGDIVVHLFTAEAREAYDLENLWGDAPRVDWKAELAAKSTKESKPAVKQKAKAAEASESEAKKPTKPRSVKKPSAPRKKKPADE
jgi:ribosome-associated protein